MTLEHINENIRHEILQVNILPIFSNIYTSTFDLDIREEYKYLMKTCRVFSSACRGLNTIMIDMPEK